MKTVSPLQAPEESLWDWIRMWTLLGHSRTLILLVSFRFWVKTRSSQALLVLLWFIIWDYDPKVLIRSDYSTWLFFFFTNLSRV